MDVTGTPFEKWGEKEWTSTNSERMVSRPRSIGLGERLAAGSASRASDSASKSVLSALVGIAIGAGTDVAIETAGVVLAGLLLSLAWAVEARPRAGLACADELNKIGHTVTVFERGSPPERQWERDVGTLLFGYVGAFLYGGRLVVAPFERPAGGGAAAGA